MEINMNDNHTPIKTNKVRQHIIPQFLQKNFAWKDNAVNIYIKKADTIKTTSTRDIMYAKYFYGESGYVEDLLSNIESAASHDIQEMIDASNHKNGHKRYMRTHPALSPKICEFLISLYARTKHSINNQISAWDDYEQYAKTDYRADDIDKMILPLISAANLKQRNTNEFNGDIAKSVLNDADNLNLDDNKKYKLIKTSTSLFLSENPVQGYLPLGPNLLLVYGLKVEQFNNHLQHASLSLLIDYLNRLALEYSDNVIIIEKNTPIEYIHKLLARWPDVSSDELRLPPQLMSQYLKHEISQMDLSTY